MQSDWQFRGPSEEGDGGGWLPSTPPIGPNVTTLAALLLEHEPREPTSLVAPDGSIWRLRYADGAIHLDAQEPDARVTPLSEADDQDLADLLTWVHGSHRSHDAETAATGAGAPEATAALMSPGAWRALHAEHWLSQAIRSHWHLETACLLYEGGGELRGWAAQAALPLSELRWDEPDNRVGWRLVCWLQSRSPGWRSVRAVVPARGYVQRFAVGEIADPSALTATLLLLCEQVASVPITLLMALAPALDEAGIAHGLRHGESHTLSRGEGADARIELTTDGLVWLLPDPADIADIELVRLTFGAPADVVPEPLRRACTQALQRSDCAENTGLWWWQHGADVRPAQMTSAADLHDALTWAEARTRQAAGVLPAIWLRGMLTLADAQITVDGALDEATARRVCGLVGLSGAGGAVALQSLTLVGPGERERLLGDAGLSLQSVAAPPLHLHDATSPRLTELSHDA